jgi:isopenicillin-N N-acyltransferase like protein
MRPVCPFLRKILAVVTVAALFCGSAAQAETVARCGKGWLELVDGYRVLHLKGSHYEMGYQHGALLKDHVRQNLDYILHEKGAAPVQLGPLRLYPKAAIVSISNYQTEKNHIPQKYLDEIAGVAAGSGLSVADARMGNFLPELFHCSGFAVMNSATKDGTLYHGRVLDYACDWKLQEHAVLIVAEPDGGIPFVNVTYAGFIGSVTGMNAEHVAIGEMGGGGFGHWNGVPMAFLVREVLERAQNLEAATAIFRDSPRTCQYFYVISDGKTNEAVGMEASWDRFEIVKSGTAHKLLPKPVADCVLLSAGKRYDELVRRAQTNHGKLDAEGALRLMDRGVAMNSNLHNVLFAPKSTKIWIANATADKQPAAEQPYQEFELAELLRRQPDPKSPEIPFSSEATAQK